MRDTRENKPEKQEEMLWNTSYLEVRKEATARKRRWAIIFEMM
jgi:hypothetical protein